MDNDYKFGQIYENEVKFEDIDHFANLFGEGSESLTELIKYCMENDLRTFASCKGHPEECSKLDAMVETGYLAFRITNNVEFAYFLASIPYVVDNVKAVVDYEYSTFKKSVTLYVPATRKEMSEPYFKEILNQLKKYKTLKDSGGIFIPQDDVVTIVDYAFLTPSNTCFYITNKGFERVDKNDGTFDFKVSKCPRREKTNKLHNMICDLFNKPKNVDDLIRNKPRMK